MMINYIFCFIIIFLMYKSLSLTVENQCPDPNKKIYIDRIIGLKILGEKFSKSIGIPTINVKLDKQIDCGYYTLNTVFGPAVLIVGKENRTFGGLNFLTFSNEINKIDRFELRNLNKVINKKNDFITTYNKGCCNNIFKNN
jgi:hypothetical protein